MISAYWLFAIVPASAFVGFMLSVVCQMAHDPFPEWDESHAQTRYDETAELVKRLGKK